MIGGKKHWLWRAVEQDGVVLDVLVQSRRDKKAAKRLLRKLLKKQCRAPRVMITDKLASYGAAKAEVMPSVEHRRHKGLNNRAENSHQPTRRRERQMKRFKSPGQALVRNSGSGRRAVVGRAFRRCAATPASRAGSSG
jgi:putative transposase